MNCFTSFLTRTSDIPELDHAIDGIIRFVKRTAKIESSHQAIISSELCDIIFTAAGQQSYGNFILHVSKGGNKES
jgi:hypothetical protein